MGEGYKKPSEAEIGEGEDHVNADENMQEVSQTREMKMANYEAGNKSAVADFAMGVEAPLSNFENNLLRYGGGLESTSSNALSPELMADRERASKIAEEIRERLEELKALKFAPPEYRQ